MAALNAMHIKLNQQLAQLGGRIDAIFFCPHAPDEQCECRKPLPGLFEQIGERYGMHLKGVPVVGDTQRDLQAGIAVGCEPHLVRTGKAAALDDAQLDQWLARLPGTTVHDDLGAFADFIIDRERRRKDAEH